MKRTVAAVLLLLSASCGNAPEARSVKDEVINVIAPIANNIRSGRVRQYLPEIDYFPEKTSFRYTKQVSIDYHGNYKVLTLMPAPNPKERFQYVLVQRGTPIPHLSGNVKTIEVPVRDFMLTHQELLGAAEIVGLADKLTAVANTAGVRAPEIRARIDKGEIAAVGSDKHLDIERVIQMQPDLVLTYWSVGPQYNAHPVLDQAGIKSMILASHWETSVLGEAEWMKVMAVLFNRERDVNLIFDGIADRYERLAARARALPDKHMVLTRIPFRHIWYVVPPPDEIADAGGEYFWKGETRPKGIDIEAVARKGRDANAWIISFPTPIRTQDELLAREPRLTVFDAVRRGRVWNYDLLEMRKDLPYHDRRMRPDLVLADLVKILHPELAPEHEFVFYRHLDPSTRFMAAQFGPRVQ